MAEVNFYEGKTALIYARVSTEEQADRATSIDTQLKRARKWCEDNGVVILGEYFDGGVSGTTSDREGYSDMFGDIVAKRPNYIVVRDASRVTRAGVGETEKLKAVCNALSVEFHFLERGRGFADDDDLETEFMDEVESAVNRHYVKTAKKNTRQSVKRNIEEGKHVSRSVTFAFEEDIPLMPKGRILYEDRVREVKKNGVVERRITKATDIRSVRTFFGLVDRGASIEVIAEFWKIKRGALSDAVHGITRCGLPKRRKVGICEKIDLPNRFAEYQARLAFAVENGADPAHDLLIGDAYRKVQARRARSRGKTVSNSVDDEQGSKTPEITVKIDVEQGCNDEC